MQRRKCRWRERLFETGKRVGWVVRPYSMTRRAARPDSREGSTKNKEALDGSQNDSAMTNAAKAGDGVE
eukprot:scaffold246415_cov27-Tisochrysis_lutea.AAC.3